MKDAHQRRQNLEKMVQTNGNTPLDEPFRHNLACKRRRDTSTLASHDQRDGENESSG